MDASVVELRYKMKDILKALERKEKVNIKYHGKVKGIITPVGIGGADKISEHPFFGMIKTEEISVAEQIDTLRGGRYDDI